MASNAFAGDLRKPVDKDDRDWIALRMALWPHRHRAEHATEISQAATTGERFLALIAYRDEVEAVGLVEARIRTDYVNGTSGSPVVFLEGLYVLPSARNQGIARALVAAVETWGACLGLTEFASDARIDNDAALRLHHCLGFEETERVVFFRKRIGPKPLTD